MYRLIHVRATRTPDSQMSARFGPLLAIFKLFAVLLLSHWPNGKINLENCNVKVPGSNVCVEYPGKTYTSWVENRTITVEEGAFENRLNSS